MVESFDAFHMKRAIDLARQPVSAPHPNPRVGCVITDRQGVVSEGFHRAAGTEHAEIAALDAVNRSVKGGTMYVTMEPCATYGRTPPCVERIVNAAINRVVIADLDPNPVNGGMGVQHLRQAGLRTEVGVLAGEAREINQGFFSRHLRGRPWVVVKIAATLDGRVAAASGESQWISGEAARSDVQQFRAQADAILTGVGTVLADNPRLSCRAAGATRQPLRIVLDSRLRTPNTANLFDVPGELVFAVTEGVCSQRREDIEQRAKVLQFDTKDDRIDCEKLLTYLADQEINEVLVEAGPTLIGSLFQFDLVDELVVYLAPALLGESAIGMVSLPEVKSFAERLRGQFKSIHRVGEDMRIHFRSR